jgi:hypothetical protein
MIMKKFFIFISLILFAFLLWGLSFPRSFNVTDYVTEEILAKSTPINVRIDVDLMKSLSPAYE